MLFRIKSGLDKRRRVNENKANNTYVVNAMILYKVFECKIVFKGC